MPAQEKMTVTEALAEIKLIEKKIAKKEETVRAHLSRYENTPDPFQSVSGGSKAAVQAEVQSVKDLREKLVRIRGAIATANIENTVTVGEATRNIYDWLTWKREIANKERDFYQAIHTTLKLQLDTNAQRPNVYKDETGVVQVAKLIPNVDYAEFLTRHQKLTDMIETVDGKLSLKNATILISF